MKVVEVRFYKWGTDELLYKEETIVIPQKEMTVSFPLYGSWYIGTVARVSIIFDVDCIHADVECIRNG